MVQDDHDRPLLLTVAGAARALSCSERTVYNLADRGDIALAKVGRATRVTTASILAFIDRQKRVG